MMRKAGWMVLLSGMLSACGPDATPPPLTPNPPAADCLVERDERQAECFHLYKLETERTTCLKRVRENIDCSTKAGVDAWMSGKKDGGS